MPQALGTSIGAPPSRRRRRPRAASRSRSPRTPPPWHRGAGAVVADAPAHRHRNDEDDQDDAQHLRPRDAVGLGAEAIGERLHVGRAADRRAEVARAQVEPRPAVQEPRAGAAERDRRDRVGKHERPERQRERRDGRTKGEPTAAPTTS
jgi:hypothetical protein